MGCTASSSANSSSAPKTKNIRNLKLQAVGVYSVDRFVDQVEEIIERFGKLTDDIERKREKLLHLTDFDIYRPEQVRLKYAVVGMLLQFFSLANGDLSKVKVELKEKKPFLKLKLNGVDL